MLSFQNFSQQQPLITAFNDSILKNFMRKYYVTATELKHTNTYFVNEHSTI